MPSTESICVHCGDDIVLHDTKRSWVDVNGLSSCAPYAPHHEPVEKYVALAVTIPDGTLAHYWVHMEQWEEDIEPLLAVHDEELSR